MAKLTAKEEKIFKERMEQRDAELRWLYMELYNNSSMYGELVERIHEFYVDRRKGLKKLDELREKTPDWYKGGDQLGMMLYIDNFAGNIRGVMDKLDYLEDANVNYIHLMPFLPAPGRPRLSKVPETKFFIHLYLVLMAGEN